MRTVILTAAFCAAIVSVGFAADLSVRETGYTYKYSGLATDEESHNTYVIGSFNDRVRPKEVRKSLELKVKFGANSAFKFKAPIRKLGEAEPVKEETINVVLNKLKEQPKPILRVSKNDIIKSHIKFKPKAETAPAKTHEVKQEVKVEEIKDQPVEKPETKASNSACANLPKVYFEIASTSVMPKQIESLVADLKKCNVENKPLKVVGYTCDIGSQKYNDDLAVKRANAVAEKLAEAGFEIKSVEGVGKAFYVTRDPSKRKLNRRAEASVQF